jgi:DNA-binding beta-propeller fold protein YncE/4-amino-4-deoxy-L-arabinose transferase-like glycosyltransferase
MRARIPRVLASIGLFALLAGAWRAQWFFQFSNVRSTGGWWLLGTMVALFILWFVTESASAAPGDFETPRMGADGAPRRSLSTASEWILAGALCLLGVAFRTIHFSTVPAGMNHDAAFNGMFALNVLEGAPYTPYISAAWGRETLFMYLCTPLVAWLGNVPEAIQVAGTLVGVATLPVFYLFARALCGKRIALVALAFLALSGWHGVFSRVGWRMLMVPLFECMALLGLWRALQTGARRDWLLTGAGAALAIYTYDAGRLVPVMVAVVLGLFTLVDRQRRQVRVIGGFVALATFLLVGSVMLYYAATHFEQFSARASHLAGEEPHTLLPTLVAAAGMFNYRGNGNDFFINEPLLEPLAGVLFVFGFLVCIATACSFPRGAARASGRVPEEASDERDRLGMREVAFIFIGLAVALLPGVLAVPNGNRCINALPFVYILIAVGAVSVVDAVTRSLEAPARQRAAVALLAVLIACAGIETYREYLGETRRPILGFGPEATAAGEYLRGFGSNYARYIVAEDWPEYTLDYLSYNGGGTPLERQYLLGRRLEDIESRVNRYGRKGLVFLTDVKPAGRHALERLQRLFAEHRTEPVLAPRLGGRQVATAFIVEPQSAGRTGLWSNTTRALAVGGDDAAVAMRCFAPVGDAHGISLRLQIMRAEHVPADGSAASAAATGASDGRGGEIRFLTQCPAEKSAAAALALALTTGGLELHGNSTSGNYASLTAVDASTLETGRWYEVSIIIQPDGTMHASVDGKPVTGAGLKARGTRPLSIAGLQLAAPAGSEFFIDDLAVIPGLVKAGSEGQAAATIDGAFQEDFETTPYGLVAPDAQWRRVDGPVSALTSPAAVARAAAAPPEAGNAFDGGHGTAAGQFNDPVGIAVDAAGDVYVADKDNHRIQQFDRSGAFVRSWGQKGELPGEFNQPHDVAVDAEFVYVADTWNQRVQVFDHTGAHVFDITGTPSMSTPRAVLVKDRLIYAVESGAGRVAVYDRSGALRQTIGVLGGDAPGHLVEPVDVALDTQGDIWVVNSGNNRIEHFAPDGTPRGSVPVSGWSGNALKESYLTIDADGTLYLGDWEHGNVRRFRPDGSELEPIGSGLRRPSGMVLDRNRLLIVARGDDVVRVLPLQAPASEKPQAESGKEKAESQ